MPMPPRSALGEMTFATLVDPPSEQDVVDLTPERKRRARAAPNAFDDSEGSGREEVEEVGEDVH